MKKSKTINEGGINGLGESLVNMNSQSFKALKGLIVEHSSSQRESQIVNNKILSLRFQMESYLSEEGDEEIVPAGNYIERLLKATGVSKRKFSDYIDYDYSNLIATLKGRRKVNADLAMKVGKIFGISPAMWLQIETKNDLLAYQRTAPSYDNYSLLELIK